MVTTHQSGMAHSTTDTIRKNKRKIMEVLKGSALLKAAKPINIWEGPMSDMEKFLTTWIRDQTQKRVSVSTMVIMTKAKSFFVKLKEKTGPNCNVKVAASSW